MGEKYDGIRACWNPVKKKMYTKNIPCYINILLIETGIQEMG
jgi:hypothetical protein